jgi:two-component system, OmpR family, sensor histidine kinase VanS
MGAGGPHAGPVTFTRQWVDLSLLAEEAAETLLPFAEKRGLTIECSADITHAFGSRTLLLQMITNLLHNAIVHNIAAYGIVQVSAFSGPGSVTLAVVNTGAELSPQLVATLIEPFQRGAARTSGAGAGVGLGLAIVKSIAEAHDGTLALAPRVGGGLCVTVRLPTAPAPGQNQEINFPERSRVSPPSE